MAVCWVFRITFWEDKSPFGKISPFGRNIFVMACCLFSHWGIPRIEQHPQNRFIFPKGEKNSSYERLFQVHLTFLNSTITMLVLSTTLLLVSVNPGFNLLPHANGVHLKKKQLALKKYTKKNRWPWCSRHRSHHISSRKKVSNMSPKSINKPVTYCWWKKSPTTTWDVKKTL